MPNRLWSWAASVLEPQPDSTMAWAIVTAAGTPYLRWAAIAPGAICSMNVRSALVGAAATGVARAGLEGADDRARAGLGAVGCVGWVGLAAEASADAGTPGISLQPGEPGPSPPPCAASSVCGRPEPDPPVRSPPDGCPVCEPPPVARPPCLLVCGSRPLGGAA